MVVGLRLCKITDLVVKIIPAESKDVSNVLQDFWVKHEGDNSFKLVESSSNQIRSVKPFKSPEVFISGNMVLITLLAERRHLVGKFDIFLEAGHTIIRSLSVRVASQKNNSYRKFVGVEAITNQCQSLISALVDHFVKMCADPFVPINRDETCSIFEDDRKRERGSSVDAFVTPKRQKLFAATLSVSEIEQLASYSRAILNILGKIH